MTTAHIAPEEGLRTQGAGSCATGTLLRLRVSRSAVDRSSASNPCRSVLRVGWRHDAPRLRRRASRETQEKEDARAQCQHLECESDYATPTPTPAGPSVAGG